jgi:hypothetical protein
MRHITIILLASAALCGCATQSLYQWGGYDQALYAGYKDPQQMQALRLKLESHIAAMEQGSQKVAPGLHAELGTLYVQSGATDKAIAQYTRERDAWPESRALMTSMISNLQRRQQRPVETTK